jgi:hypothetical protein
MITNEDRHDERTFLMAEMNIRMQKILIYSSAENQTMFKESRVTFATSNIDRGEMIAEINKTYYDKR